MNDSRYFIAKGKHLVVPVTKQEYEDYWNKKRKKPITNEEWFCSLSTEEKAEWLENKMTWAAQEQGTLTAKGWEMWLKKPHTERSDTDDHKRGF